MNASTDWQLGLFNVLAGARHDSTVCTTAGWHRDPFGIDRRWLDRDGEITPCWCVSHLATGYVICAFIGDEDEAKALVDQFEGLGDWDFVDPQAAKALSPAMREIFRDNPMIFDPYACLPQLWLRKKKVA